jgi:acyl-[acyl-carrier-protein]-phospholipid O-acyltransferase/long-chain-fatty-acid--[acyl-carrier-protein] ligase
MDAQSDELLRERIREARSKFAAMAGTYFAGVLNDNFFRQSALLLAVAADKSHLQGHATVVFTLPFILFAAPAGFLADRFSKRSVVITSKVLELAAMSFAALGIYYFRWHLIIVTLGIMGLQSALFGPSLRGSIPELYPAEYVVKANAIIRTISTGAILAGIAAAGFVLDRKGTVGSVPLGRVMAASGVVGISLIGVMMSLGVPKYPPACPTAAFPWRGPLDSVKTLYDTRRDSLLAISIATKAFFWFLGSLQILVINALGMRQFALTKTVTSELIVAELVGIAIGSLLSARVATGKKWYRVLAPATLAIAAFMFLVALVPRFPETARAGILASLLCMMGIAGGVLSVPLASYVQVKPPAEIKGTTIAASSFADFAGILISGPVYYLLNCMQVKPTNCFALMGAMIAGVGVWLWVVLHKREADG